jgi:hypothetical protein
MSIVGFIMPVLGQNDRMDGYPVGGVVTAVNKLAVVAPYIVLAGIVTIASAVYIKRRKK